MFLLISVEIDQDLAEPVVQLVRSCFCVCLCVNYSRTNHMLHTETCNGIWTFQLSVIPMGRSIL